jgi:hypothetical protein
MALFTPITLVQQTSSEVTESVTQNNGNKRTGNGSILTGTEKSRGQHRQFHCMQRLSTVSTVYFLLFTVFSPLLLIASLYGRTAHMYTSTTDMRVADNRVQRRKRNKAARLVVFLKQTWLSFHSSEQ